MGLCKKFHSRCRFVLVGLCATVVLGGDAVAATYYVDPATGANSNAGTTPGAPWQNPPGTRNPSDTGFSSSNWGSITASNRLQCGDLILLRGGSTQTSSRGGGWLIDSTYYAATCTGTSGEGAGSGRITIRVATGTEWTGSAGAFTLDGAGISPPNPLGDFRALVFVHDMDSITVSGVSSAQRLVVRNSSEGGMTVWGNNNEVLRFKGQWLEVGPNAAWGIDLGSVVNWVIRDSIAHDNGQCGFCAGLLANWPSRDGAYLNTEAYANGSNATVFSGHHDGYFYINVSNLWTIRAQAHHNFQRGFNSGSIAGGASPQQFRYREIESWDNGRLTTGNTRGGFDVSGEDNLALTVQNFIVRGRFYHNPGLGWGGYGGVDVEGWHIVSFRNGWVTDGQIWWDRGSNSLRVYNGIYLNRSSAGETWTHGTSNLWLDRQPISNYNIYRPQSSTSELFSTFNHTGTVTIGDRTYAQGVGFTGANDRVGLTNSDPAFVSLGSNCDAGTLVYQDCDFHLRSTSNAIDGGQFLMRANGAGTNATTINVLGNGGSGDPRNYFIGPSSFLEATPDVIQIQGCGTVTITGMTASSISFATPCTWANGAGIHFPWAGARPDMGAFEYGLGTPSAPAAPTNLRILQ